MSPHVHTLWATGAFPTLEGSTSGGTSSLTGDPPLDLSALPLTEGNLLVLVFRSDSEVHDGPSGWTKEADVTYDSPETSTMSVWSKTVGASESDSQTFEQSSSDRCGWVCFELSGAHGDVEASIVEEYDPPNLSPAWGDAKTLWLTACGVSASDNTLTRPSGYSDQVDGASDPSTADSRSRCAMALRENEASSENPGSWGVSGDAYRALTATIGVRPA